MQKKIVFAFILGLGLFMANTASAVVTNFGDYTIDIPRSWKYTVSKDNLVTITSPDQKAAFLITSGLSMSMHKQRISNELKTTFSSITANHPERVVTLTRVQWKRIVVTIVGDHPDRVPMYHSIKEVSGGKEYKGWKYSK